MAVTNYRARWGALEEKYREANDVQGRVSIDREAWDRSTRQTLTAFLADLYADHWRNTYALLGLELPGAFDVLRVRAIEVHHWTPEEVHDLTLEDLTKALIQDISHCPCPADAIQAIEYGLGDLPERHDVVAHLRAQAGRPQNPA